MTKEQATELNRLIADMTICAVESSTFQMIGTESEKEVASELYYESKQAVKSYIKTLIVEEKNEEG